MLVRLMAFVKRTLQRWIDWIDDAWMSPDEVVAYRLAMRINQLHHDFYDLTPGVREALLAKQHSEEQLRRLDEALCDFHEMPGMASAWVSDAETDSPRTHGV